MSEALLPYYERELEALRRLAATFAADYPKIAGRLRLTRDGANDPHVDRLLEGVAFLGARVQHRLDDEFPELTDALLSVLYPHYLAPFPSAAIACFTPDPGLTGPMSIPAGLELDTEPVRGESCRFRSAYPLTLWPIKIETARLSGLPLAAPPNPAAAAAVACLRISLRCLQPEMTLSQLGLDRLRVFLRGATAPALLELLTAHVLGVALADAPEDRAPVLLDPSSIQPVGFGPDEALLPWPARSFSGFRLLSEYFALPEKFHFLDFSGLAGKTLLGAEGRLDLFVYLDRSAPELERTVDANCFAIGCTPIVNLFAQRCDPIHLDHTSVEYRVVPDARRPQAMEIWSVDRVRESTADGRNREWQPFYRLTNPAARPPDAADGEDDAGGAYLTGRREAIGSGAGTEVYLLPHDPAFDPTRSEDAVLSIDATCLNRDLPAALPFGGGHPRLRIVEGQAAIDSVTCLTPPTPTFRRPAREKTFWRLISHLSLGHLSVTGGAAGAAVLAEILRLYDVRDSAETRAAIRALLSVTATPGVARVPGSRLGTFCRGLDVTLTFDPGTWAPGGLYLLASVLDRFLALHASVNSFVRTRVVLSGHPDAVVAWPPRAGARVLL
ncbi:MAG: type VI secretion system baseplate subunit TssF [Rhodospirillales bacterium]|nr:type VI secretion system baseplate subunit TssF [Rhodospirillales bacterium]